MSPMRRESGRAAGTGRPKKVRKIRQDERTSSLGSNAAAAHGYTPKASAKPIPKQAPSRRTNLRQAAAKPTEQERAVQYDTRMRAKAPVEAARQQKIVDTQERLTKLVRSKDRPKGVQAADKVRFDQRTGNYVAHRERHLLPDEHYAIDARSGKAAGIGKQLGQQNVQHAEVVAPALKIMDQTLRPTRAIAGSVEAARTGTSVGQAVKKGLLKNKGPTFGKVLKDAGAPKPLAAVAGFGLDVATDPTTYVTGGAGGVAKKAGEDAAREVAKKAARAGLSKEVGAKLGATAARQAERRVGDKGTGAVVKFAGHEVPGVRRATAAAGRPLVRRTSPGVKHAARETVAQVNPNITPTGMTREEFRAGKQAERRARAQRAKAVRTAQERGRLYARTLNKDEHAQVVDAIERGKIGKLPEHLRQPAVALRSEYRFASRQRRRAGMGEGVIGREAPVREVPAVTANPDATAKRLAKEERRRARIQGKLAQAQARKGVAQGRSEILSRNVEGRRGELAAVRAGNDRARMPGRRAAGQAGVTQVEKDIAVAQRRLRAAEMRVSAAKDAHELEKATAGRQRAARYLAEKKAARRQGEARDYFPHMLESTVEGEATKAERGARTLRPGSSMRRENKRPISDQNATLPPEERFSTNIPLVHANYTMETGSAVAQNQLNRELAERARTVRPGQGPITLREGENIYHVAGGKPRPLTEEQARKVLDGRGNLTIDRTPILRDGKQASGRLVVLHKDLVERARKLHGDERTAPGRIFDLAQGKWKRLATGTPGFHVRNAIGDTQMAYLAQKGHRLPVTTVQAGRALKRLTQREASTRRDLVPSAAARTEQTIKVGRERVNVDDFLNDAMDQGVLRSAQVGRELEEFRLGTGAVSTSTSRKLRRTVSESRPTQTLKEAGRSLNRGFQNREDLMRLATYKYGLDSGLSKQEAADLAMAFHIDYTDVTDFERKALRRAMPFYTFSARALPIHVKALIQKPGKIAAIEKARVELSNAFGLDPNWEGDVSEYKQRAIPFGAKIGGKNVALDAALPVGMLNELPVSANPKDYAEEWARFAGGLLSPAIKIPIEAYSKQSLTFREPIERPYRPIVSAPSWATKLPMKLQKQLGVVNDFVDPKTGRKVPGWGAWTNYWFSQLPGLAYQFRQMTTPGTLVSGRQGWQKLSGTVGVKADPIDPKTARIGELFQRVDKVNTELNKLRQRGASGGAKSSNPQMRLLTKELARLNYTIYAQSVARGDRAPMREGQISNKKLLKPRVKARGMPAKPRRPKGAFGGGGSGGGFGGGMSSGGGGF